MTLTNDMTFPQLQYLTADNINSPEVSAIFTTRNGGISGKTPETEHFRSLNLQFNSERDTYLNVAENYRIVASSQGFKAEDVMSLWQKHTDKIIVVDKKIAESRPHYKIGEADALITNIKGVLLSIRISDCVPILLYDSVNGAIGAIHAGWKGTLLQIGKKTLQSMSKLYGTDPIYIHAAIGAAIGVCCYEVGLDLYGQFRNEYGEAIDKFFEFKKGTKPYFNLSALNKSFLIEAGIPEQNIDMSEMCTMCNPELFYSHRRSGEKRGSMAAFIGMKS